MAKKLTPSQVSALALAEEKSEPLDSIEYLRVGAPGQTIHTLSKRGLLVEHRVPWRTWALTDAGRAALAEHRRGK